MRPRRPLGMAESRSTAAPSRAPVGPASGRLRALLSSSSRAAARTVDCMVATVSLLTAVPPRGGKGHKRCVATWRPRAMMLVGHRGPAGRDGPLVPARLEALPAEDPLTGWALAAHMRCTLVQGAPVQSPRILEATAAVGVRTLADFHRSPRAGRAEGVGALGRLAGCLLRVGPAWRLLPPLSGAGNPAGVRFSKR